ncbi:MAG: phytochelatin synthase family protein [Deltaproteobacteria bacterium]|nr:phytochelatin synthase family protein [Deltaproteobacteria bacterium]
MISTTSSTFYRRPLPDGLIPFASAEGRQLFQEALTEGGMQGWFSLAEQFHTQSDPAFCGLGSLVVALNALQIDPGRIWKGPWRWYSEELLDCCLPLEEVRSKGVTLEELACLARCNGAEARSQHADANNNEAALRETIVRAASSPHGPIVIAAYTRRVLGQTGDGHFSPVAGYHRGRDLVLVLDVARFKYPPHWIPLPLLHEAMQPIDPASGLPRGWLTLKRNEQASALLFRIVSNEDAQALSASVFDGAEFPVHATASGFAQAFSERMRPAAAPWLTRALTGLATLPAEHLAAVQAMRAQLHDSQAFALVRQAAPSVGDEAVAMLLLAMPATLLRDWHAPEAVLKSLEMHEPSQAALAAEVISLRSQLETLCQWRLRQSDGSCNANVGSAKC